jgi:hypothetical protein
MSIIFHHYEQLMQFTEQQIKAEENYLINKEIKKFNMKSEEPYTYQISTNSCLLFQILHNPARTSNY